MATQANHLKPALSQTPFQQFGGKWEFSPWIVEHLPRGHTLVLTHFGSGSPLWHVEPQTYLVEVANDLDDTAVNFFHVCRERAEELATVFELTPYSLAEFQHCIRTLTEGDALERARKFGVVARQCRGGNRGKPTWSRSITHSRRKMGSGNSRWLHLPEAVWQIRDRLASVQIDCLDAIECIRRYDRSGTVFYCDPPYHEETRKLGAYRHEYTHEQHAKLLDVLQGIEGKAVLSGYDCDLYKERLSGWVRVEREVTCRSNVKGNGEIAARPKRQEVLWIKNGVPTTPGSGDDG